MILPFLKLEVIFLLFFYSSMNAKEEIKSSEEFSRLLKALEENASNLGTEELINCLSLFHWFELPKEDFFVVLMTTLIERVSDLELEKAVFLLELAKTVDKDDTDDLRNELIEELKFKIENEILEQEQTGDGLSDLDAGLAIRYTQIEDCSNWPDELLTKLIVKVLGLFLINFSLNCRFTQFFFVPF